MGGRRRRNPGHRSHARPGTVVGPAQEDRHDHRLDRRARSHVGCRRIFGQILRENVAAALDLAYFSDTAASAAAHAGLLAGVTPLTASTAGGVAAAQSDLAALASAVSGREAPARSCSSCRAPVPPRCRWLCRRRSITVLGTDALPPARSSRSIRRRSSTPPTRIRTSARRRTRRCTCSDTPPAIGTPPAVVASPRKACSSRARSHCGSCTTWRSPSGGRMPWHGSPPRTGRAPAVAATSRKGSAK